MPDRSVDVIFADPPYNIGKAEWDRISSIGEYVEWCLTWLVECERVLKTSGSCFVCGYSEILAHLLVSSAEFFPNHRWLVWHYRNKPSLGKNDWVRSHESILHLRLTDTFRFNADLIREPYNKHTKQYPERPQGKRSQYQKKGSDTTHWWSPDNRGAKPRDVIDIPALNNSMKEKTSHPTQKPEALLRKLLMGTAPSDGTVVDFFLGSGTTAVVAEQLNLSWVGCEQNEEYVQLALDRVQSYLSNPVPLEKLLQTDLSQAQNRAKVRG